ncbi:TPA: hypothetical protein HA265_07035, partial [Candidatus Woesearchaeota archaeon]|nr:hypothetical protein [Candidatus Woesearchaeota archaeon]
MKLISSNIFLKHKLEGHVERPERIKRLLTELEFEKADKGDIYLHLVHTPEYIEKVKNMSLEAGDRIRHIDAGDTYVTAETYNVAVTAVGAAVKAADYVLKGQNAFALVRPPGHHAHPGWTGGFCIFNNAAIGAAYMLQKGKKVLIFDFDMHRGDGTQDCVKQLNKHFPGKVYYFSINQEGVFPGASLDEGNVYNVYLPPGTTENEYLELMRKELDYRIKQFRPDAIVISAGFDCFAKDAEQYYPRLGCALLL